VRDKHLDPKHAAELKSILDGVTRKGREKLLLPDLSMTVADPYVLHFLNQLIAKVLGQCLVNETLPRDYSPLQLLLRLANLGVHSFHLTCGALYPPDPAAQSGEYREPKLDSPVYTRFLASLVTLMGQEQYVALNEQSRLSQTDAGDTRGGGV